MRQAFAAGQWEKALHGAHAVADLTGPDPEGRFAHVGPSIAKANPHATVGVEHSRVVFQENSTIIDGGGMKRLTLRVVASPGHPLCEKCHLPLGIVLEPDGNARTRCPSCSDEAVYALPEGAAEKAPALRAVIGREHRVDQPVAKIGTEDAAGVAALLCPSCGAALPVTGGADVATCTFCHTTSRIARPAWGRASGEAPPHEPFWVLLEGPSQRRHELEGGASGDEDDLPSEVRRAIAEASAGVRVPAPRRDWQLIRMIVAGVVLLGVVALVAGQKIYASIHANDPVSRPSKAHPATRPTHR